MTARLRPMSAAEFPAWRARSEAGYAADMQESGGVPAEAAHAKAAADFEALLTNGLDSPGLLLYVIEDDGVPVGELWLGERSGPTGRILFVWELHVAPAFRGRGLGRAAMLLAEDIAREHGLPAIELNVFGGNEVARRLYRSLGYEESSVHMRKRV